MKAPLSIPLQITFHGIDPSSAVEELVTAKAEKLWKLYPRTTSCRVAVEKPHRFPQNNGGEQFEVRIDLTVPGDEIVVRKDPGDVAEQADVGAAVRHAFATAERRLKDFVSRRRDAEIRVHEEPEHALVTKLFAERGYGFVETEDGREAYFHRKSVLGGGFKRLAIGNEVRVSLEQGEKGLQASTVQMVGREGRHEFPRDVRQQVRGERTAEPIHPDEGY